MSEKKKKKDEFLQAVKKLMNETKIESVRKCAKRARQYICAYHEVHHGTAVGTAVPKEIIEKLMLTSYKSHRVVNATHVAFVSSS